MGKKAVTEPIPPKKIKKKEKKSVVKVYNFKQPEGYNELVIRAADTLKKISEKILIVWIKRYITKDVAVYFDKESGDFVFYTSDLLNACRIEQMLDEITLKGYVSRFYWISS
jgi:hypothetical protein